DRRVAHQGFAHRDGPGDAGYRRRARVGASRGDLVVAAQARGLRCDVHPHVARRTDGAVSSPVKTSRSILIEEIVNDVRARGDAELAEGSKRFDATKESKNDRGDAFGDTSKAAVLESAGSVSPGHEAQRRQALMMEVSPGVTLKRRWT